MGGSLHWTSRDLPSRITCITGGIFSGLVGDRGSDLIVQLGKDSPVKGNEPAQPATMYDGGGNETRPSNVYTYYLIFSGLPQVGERVTASVQMKTGATRTAKQQLAAKPPKKLAAKPAKKAAKKSASARKTRKR